MSQQTHNTLRLCFNTDELLCVRIAASQSVSIVWRVIKGGMEGVDRQYNGRVNASGGTTLYGEQ